MKTRGDQTAEETIEDLVGRKGIYALGDRTPGRKVMGLDDWICFYASGTGVVAHVRVKSAPEGKGGKGGRVCV